MGPGIEDREKKERKKAPWKVKKKAYNDLYDWDFKHVCW